MTEADVNRIVERLKISRAERNLALFLVEWRELAMEMNDVKAFMNLLVDKHKDACIRVRSLLSEWDKCQTYIYM